MALDSSLPPFKPARKGERSGSRGMERSISDPEVSIHIALRSSIWMGPCRNDRMLIHALHGQVNIVCQQFLGQTYFIPLHIEFNSDEELQLHRFLPVSSYRHFFPVLTWPKGSRRCSQFYLPPSPHRRRYRLTQAPTNLPPDEGYVVARPTGLLVKLRTDQFFDRIFSI